MLLEEAGHLLQAAAAGPRSWAASAHMRQPLPHVRLAHIQLAQPFTTQTPFWHCPLCAGAPAATAVPSLPFACCAAIVRFLATLTVVYGAAAALQLASAHARLCGSSRGRCLLKCASAGSRRAAGCWQEGAQEAGRRAGAAGAEAGQQQGHHDANAHIRPCTRSAPSIIFHVCFSDVPLSQPLHQCCPVIRAQQEMTGLNTYMGLKQGTRTVGAVDKHAAAACKVLRCKF